MVVQFFTALTAIVGNFQIFPKNLTFAARWALECGASADGLPDWTMFVCCTCNACHGLSPTDRGDDNMMFLKGFAHVAG